MTKNLNIQLCYSPKNEADVSILELKIPQGASIAEAIAISKIEEKFPEIDITSSKNCNNSKANSKTSGKNKVGVYTKIKPLDYIIQDGDRVEIYSKAQGNKRNL